MAGNSIASKAMALTAAMKCSGASGESRNDPAGAIGSRPHRGDEVRSGVEIGDYLRVIRNRWLVIVACTLVTTSVAAIVSLRTAATYESEIRLYVAQVADRERDAYEGGLLSIQRMATYADLTTGTELTERVERDLGVTSLPGDDPITATAVPNSLLLSVTAQGSSPEEAQRVASTAGNELIEMIRDLEQTDGRDDAGVKAEVVDPASLPSSPASPQTLRNLGIALMLGLLLGLAVALMLELLRRTPTGDRPSREPLTRNR